MARDEKESIALSILLAVSIDFENLQGSYFLSSSFSAEDLPSDVIGLYWAISGSNPVPGLQPVSKAAAEKIWDTYGGPTDAKYKDRSIKAGVLPKIHLFPCGECQGKLETSCSAAMPTALSRIKPLTSRSDIFRIWNDNDPDLKSIVAREIVVRAGESLSLIAGREYGDILLWPLIWNANKSAIGGTPHLVRPGLRLLVPPKALFSSHQIEDAKRVGRSTRR